MLQRQMLNNHLQNKLEHSDQQWENDLYKGKESIEEQRLMFQVA